MKRQGIKYFSEGEKKKFLAVLRDRKSAERDYMVFNLMFNTGLRISELVSLNVKDVQDRTSIEILGKGKKLREIPLNVSIQKHIAVFLRLKKRRREGLFDDDPLFVSRKHSRLSVRAIQRALDKWGKEAGLQMKYSPHALRHTFGTELYNRCKNLRIVQTIMGHADISTTQVYTHVTKADMREAVELLSIC